VAEETRCRAEEERRLQLDRRPREAEQKLVEQLEYELQGKKDSSDF
jgi:hypothetical protein